MTSESERRKAVCARCYDRPIGCWKARDYGCQKQFRAAEQYCVEHSSCPLDRWGDLLALHRPVDPQSFFDRAVVISLARRPERLAAFRRQIDALAWPFCPVEVFPAIDGEALTPPASWKLSRGGWGCLRSHAQVLATAVADGVLSLLVFEDDCVFDDNFAALAVEFLGRVPDDWDMLMLGYQARRHGIAAIGPGIARITSAYRFHAYAMQGEFLQIAAEALARGDWHADILVEKMQSQWKVYGPQPALCGQDAYRSDNDGAVRQRTFYAPRNTRPPAAARCPAAKCPVCSVVDPLPDPEHDSAPATWSQAPATREAHVAALAEMASRTFTPGSLTGDGIVICGEDRYWPGIVVAVRLLRTSGSDLPVQVWHNGPIGKELDDAPGVTLVDAKAVRWAHPARIFRGWEIKTYAILHSGFKRVLFLDADAYCVADPRPLFDILNNAPFVYWEDLPRCRSNVQWTWYCMTGDHVPPVQGGQLLIDVERFWREAVLSHWMNQHSDYFYRHQFGDQDSWRVALAATGQASRVVAPARWDRLAFVCGWDGVDYIVHRCRAKLFPDRLPRRWDGLPREAEVFTLYRELCPSAVRDATEWKKTHLRVERRRVLARCGR